MMERANRIIVLENGKNREIDTHEELKNRTLYFKLYIEHKEMTVSDFGN